MRVANPDTKEANWHQSKIDEDIQYKILPFKNSELTELQNYAPLIKPIGASKKEKKIDITYVSSMLLRACLKETRGILEGEGELKFKFHEEKISPRLTIELCQREIYDKIPSDLLTEIILFINDVNNISDKEEEDINFMSGLLPGSDSSPAEDATEITPNAE